MKVDDPQLENQIIAAMTFWRCVAEKSRTHPSRHPEVRKLFSVYTPMKIAEINAFISEQKGPDPGLMTVAEASAHYRVPHRTLRRRMKDLGIEPIKVLGTCGLYRESAMRLAAGKCLNNIFNRKGRRGRRPQLRGDRPGLHGGDGEDQHDGDDHQG